jgi:antitoxin ParD1/3/4
MNIILTPEDETLIDEKIKSGLYQSPSEIVREALQLLKERDRIREFRCEELRKEIQKGIDDIREGRYITLETDEDYKQLAAEIKLDGLEMLKQKRMADK